MQKSIIKYFCCFAAGFILGIIVWNIISDKNLQQKPEIIIRKVIQDVKEERIVYANPDNLQFYVDELNKYRTEPGIITVTNNTIYAALYKRAWHAGYSLPIQRHSVTIYAGQVFGMGYTYKINSWLGAGAAIFSSGLSFSMSVSF